MGWAWGLEAQLVRPRPPSCAEKLGHCPQGRGTQLANIIVISGAEGEPRINSEDNSSGPDILSLRGDGGNRYPPTKTRLKKKSKWCLSCSPFKSFFLENILSAISHDSHASMFLKPVLNTQHPSKPVACCVLSRFSRVRLFATPWPVAHQAPLSTGFSKQEYWNGLPFPPQGDLADPKD